MSSSSFVTVRIAIAAMLAACLLSACGGGGGNQGACQSGSTQECAKK